MGFTATRGSIAGYAGALVLAAAALAVRWLLDPWLGEKAPLVAGLAAVLLLAWNIGRGPRHRHSRRSHPSFPSSPSVSSWDAR